MADYTEKERHAIDAAFGKLARDEDITSDEVRLMIDFEVNKALASDSHKAEIDAIMAKQEQECRQSAEHAAIAKSTLETLAQAAQEKLKAVRNVKK